MWKLFQKSFHVSENINSSTVLSHFTPWKLQITDFPGPRVHELLKYIDVENELKNKIMKDYTNCNFRYMLDYNK